MKSPFQSLSPLTKWLFFLGRDNLQTPLILLQVRAYKLAIGAMVAVQDAKPLGLPDRLVNRFQVPRQIDE